ncbi:MAG TPA: oligosaccharide flippase family protein, partial [Candidatus Nitrosocosmicus sp.]|nr:oligosaccharide flippase family protein [Candidatus Nitrosocosmicus sp.]
MLLKNLAQNTIFQLIARSFTTLANFITILLIGSSLGSFGLGQYNKAFAFIGIFSLFVDFGINAIFLKTKDIAQNVGLLILLRLLIALTIFVLLQPLLFFLPYDPISQIGFSPDDKTFIRILSLILFTYSFSHSINAIFQAKQRFGLLVIPNIILGCNLIFFAVFAYIFKSLELFIWATVIGQIAYVITASILLRKIFDINLLDKKVLFNIKNTFQEKNKFITKLFKSSLPIAATLFLNVLYVRADTLILSFVRSTNEVGVYTLAYKFFDFPLSLSFFIMNAMYPIFLKSHETNKNRFYKMVSKFTLNTFLLSVLLTAIAFFAAPLLKYI